MIEKKKNSILYLSTLAMLLAALIGLQKMDAYAAENGAFNVTDSQGHIINSFCAKDGVNYLFLTNQSDISNITINSQIDFTAVDRADLTIDTGAKTIVGNFSVNPTVILTMSDNTTQTITLMQSGLPSMYISLNGTTIEEVNADKNTKHPGNNLTLTDNSNAANNLAESDVEIKGRGNSSWYFYDKKPYQIKFKKKKSVLGMGEAKKWVLLANSSDPTMMKNKIAFDVANRMGLAYTPSADYVDLWVDGEYLGTYLVAEKVELGKSRVNLTDNNAVLMEYDNDFYNTEQYFFVEPLNNTHFALKESANEGDLTGFNAFKSSMIDFEINMYTHRGLYSWDKVCQALDVWSFANWYVINEYFQNNESASTGFFMYQDGSVAKIIAGPVWDFDSSMGSGTKGSSDLNVYQHWLLTLLLERPEFRNMVQQVYTQYKPVLNTANDETGTLMAKIEPSANMNYLRWDVLGKTDAKKTKFPNTYEEAVSGLNTWLTARETGYRVYSTNQELYAEISPDYATTNITYKTSKNFSAVYFSVWSNENGQDDAIWYYADQTSQGTWNVKADMSKHGLTGMCTVHVWAIPSGASDLQPQMASGFYAKPDVVDGGSIVYRMYNPNSGEHFYTMNFAEVQWLSGLGWSFEGVSWNAPNKSNTPVYRIYNPNAGDHHYTMNYNEMRWLVSLGWNDEGIGWYSADNKETVLYRLYNPNARSGSHHYTINKAESDWLVSLGWNSEGIAWYGL